MSWSNSGERTNRTVEEIAARVARLFAPSSGEYTFNYIFDAVKPGSAEQLALALALLVTEGQLRKFIRVQSPTTHGGLEDFPSITDVPNEMHDLHSDRWFRVRPDDLIVMYRRNA